MSKTGNDSFAGDYIRQIIRGEKVRNEGEAIIGYSENKLIYDNLLKHTIISGDRATGKTTVTQNILLQMAADQLGFCYIDLEGGSTNDLYQRMPKNRIDDVVYYGPIDYNSSVVKGFNVFGDNTTNKNLDRVTSILLDNLIDREHIGPKLDKTLNLIIKGCIENNVQIKNLHKFLPPISDKIWDNMYNPREIRYKEVLEDDQVKDALINLKENYDTDIIKKTFTSNRGSDASMKNNIANNNILLANLNYLDYSQEEQCICLNALIQRMKFYMNQEAKTSHPDEKPFFIAIDGIESLDMENSKIKTFLRHARHYNCGVILTGKIKEMTDNDIDEIISHISTTITLRDGLTDRLILNNTTDNNNISDNIEKEVKNLSQNKAIISKLTKSGNDMYKQEMFGPIPPLRNDIPK